MSKTPFTERTENDFPDILTDLELEYLQHGVKLIRAEMEDGEIVFMDDLIEFEQKLKDFKNRLHKRVIILNAEDEARFWNFRWMFDCQEDFCQISELFRGIPLIKKDDQGRTH